MVAGLALSIVVTGDLSDCQLETRIGLRSRYTPIWALADERAESITVTYSARTSTTLLQGAGAGDKINSCVAWPVFSSPVLFCLVCIKSI